MIVTLSITLIGICRAVTMLVALFCFMGAYAAIEDDSLPGALVAIFLAFMLFFVAVKA